MRYFILFLLFMSGCIPAMAQEYIPSTDNSTTPLWNEQLRQNRSRISNLQNELNAILPIDLSLYGSSVDSQLDIIGGGTGEATAQLAINALTDVDNAIYPDESVLTKDTTTGNAIFKTASSYISAYEVGTLIEASAPTDRTAASITYVKVKEFSPLARSGEVTIYFAAEAGVSDAYARVYKNDIAVGTERTWTGSNNWSENFTAQKGDVFQIYAKDGGSSPTIVDFQIRVSKPTIPQEVSGY